MTQSSWSRAVAGRAGTRLQVGRWARALTLFSALVGGGAAADKAAIPARAPVVLELFSSEGCSSCPAADTLLAQLDAAGEVAGTKVIALELHVDYWDYLGWRDPFAAADFTARQQRYAGRLGRGSYTPQLVVDGQADVVGSQRGPAMAAIAAAAQQKSSATVELRRDGDRLAVQVSGITPGATVLLAITERDLLTKVLRGENAGHTLRHGPVVRALRQLATNPGDRYAAQVPLQLAAEWKPEALRAVVLVQAADGHMVGAGMLPLGKN